MTAKPIAILEAYDYLTNSLFVLNRFGSLIAFDECKQKDWGMSPRRIVEPIRWVYTCKRKPQESKKEGSLLIFDVSIIHNSNSTAVLYSSSA